MSEYVARSASLVSASASWLRTSTDATLHRACSIAAAAATWPEPTLVESSSTRFVSFIFFTYRTYAVTRKTRIFLLRIERFFVRRTKKRSIRELLIHGGLMVVSGTDVLRTTHYIKLGWFIQMLCPTHPSACRIRSGPRVRARGPEWHWPARQCRRARRMAADGARRCADRMHTGQSAGPSPRPTRNCRVATRGRSRAHPHHPGSRDASRRDGSGYSAGAGRRRRRAGRSR